MASFTIKTRLFSYLLLIVCILQIVSSKKFSESDCYIGDISGTSDSEIDLQCQSNGGDYLFLFWHFQDGNTVIGHSNAYDTSKYKFQTLSGNLTIRGLSWKDEGTYNCVSQGIRSNEYNICSVKLKIAERALFDTFDNISSNRSVNLWLFIGGIVALTCFAGVAAICVIHCFTKNSEYSSEPVPTDEDVEKNESEEKRSVLEQTSDHFKSLIESVLTLVSTSS